nr:unnamed protein product [Fasciola hepatica]
MNPLTNTKNQNILNERELRLGYTGTLSSWHMQYKKSAWIFVGGLNYELTEGDLICVFSQYGEIVNINLVRDRKTGQSKGFAFLCYEDQRSTVLATDNLNGIKLAGRIIRVDHVEQYKVPKDGTLDVGGSKRKPKKNATVPEDPDAVAAFVREHGCGPEVVEQLKKVQKEQKELAKKAEREKANRSPNKIPDHPRLPTRSERKRSPPDDREPHSDQPSSHAVKRRSPSWSPPHKRRGSPSRPVIDSSRKYRDGSTDLSPHEKRGSEIGPFRSVCESVNSPPRRRQTEDFSPHRLRIPNRFPPREGRNQMLSPPDGNRGPLLSPPRRRHDVTPSSHRRVQFSPSPPRRRQRLSPPSRQRRGVTPSPHHQMQLSPSPPRRRRELSPSPPRRRRGSTPSLPRQERVVVRSPRARNESTNSAPRIKQESPFNEPRRKAERQR